jgi:hypothetical protein
MIWGGVVVKIGGSVLVIPAQRVSEHAELAATDPY